MRQGGTGGASVIVKAKSFGKDPGASGGLVSNLRHRRVNKTKQHGLKRRGKPTPGLSTGGALLHASSNHNMPTRRPPRGGELGNDMAKFGWLHCP